MSNKIIKTVFTEMLALSWGREEEVLIGRFRQSELCESNTNQRR